jgi:outer membrane lipoprotein-sorting protein
MPRLSLPRPTSRRVRWGVPIAAAVVLIGVGPAVTAITADAHGSLPPRTPAQLVADVHGAKLQALSGTVVETSDLGLPSLPDVGGRGNASFSSLLSGSHTMRLWYAGPDKLRLALLGQLGESDLVRNGTDVWAWSSRDNSATHWTVPADRDAGPMGADPATSSATTPQQAAEAALKAISPSTQVTTDPTETVAGRPAYQLDLVPRDPRSLVGSVRIAIDGETHVPTRVQVFARGASHPAFEIGFTSFSTATPPDSTFAFTPPPGATVEQGQLPSHHGPTSRAGAHAMVGDRPDVVGKGWTSVLVAPLPQTVGGSQGDQTSPLLDALPRVSGAWGSGHLLRSALLSAVVTDDGRVAVGAVPPGLLYAALGRR